MLPFSLKPEIFQRPRLNKLKSCTSLTSSTSHLLIERPDKIMWLWDVFCDSFPMESHSEVCLSRVVAPVHYTIWLLHAMAISDVWSWSIFELAPLHHACLQCNRMFTCTSVTQFFRLDFQRLANGPRGLCHVLWTTRGRPYSWKLATDSGFLGPNRRWFHPLGFILDWLRFFGMQMSWNAWYFWTIAPQNQYHQLVRILLLEYSFDIC